MSAQPIIVSVETEYLSRQSQPEESRYAFAYHITIENCGSAPAQLLSRHWHTHKNHLAGALQGSSPAYQCPK